MYKVIKRIGSYELRKDLIDGGYEIYFICQLPEEDGGGRDETFMGNLMYESSFENAIDDLKEEMRIEMAALCREFGV